MKKNLMILVVLVVFSTVCLVHQGFSQAPPPPAHGQNGNQISPGGTGCTIDRTDGILFALAISLCYAGLALYLRGRKKEKTNREN